METKNIPTAIILHHEGNSNGFDIVNEYHHQKWNFKSSLGFYIGYQIYISLDGTIHRGRTDQEDGAHTLGGWNQKSIGICLQGNTDISTPTEEQTTALEKLIKEKMALYAISNNQLYCHGDLWPTTCPGKNLRNWLVNYKGGDFANLQRQIIILKNLIAELQRSLAKLIGK